MILAIQIHYLFTGKTQKEGRNRRLWILLAYPFQDLDGLFVIFLPALGNPLLNIGGVLAEHIRKEKKNRRKYKKKK